MAALSVQQALHLLELQPGATTEQIRAAYKRLALRLHPDKQKQQALRTPSTVPSPQQQPRLSSGTSSQDAGASFSLLSAAYQLLTSTAAEAHKQQSGASHGCSFPSFEAAYASGSLFTDALVDEAVVCGLPPSDIASVQQLVNAAAAGQLAEALTQNPPTADDEQMWRQLYQRLTIKWQVEKQLGQQQQQHGNGRGPAGGLLAELLADFLKPASDMLVEVSEDYHDEQSDDVAADRTQQGQTRIAVDLQQLQLQQGQPSVQPQPAAEQAGQPEEQQQQQRIVPLQHSGQLAQQQQQPAPVSSSSSSSKRRMRRGLGFYWTWFRRLVIAKAVVSILLSGRTRRADEYHGLFTML